MSTLTLYKTKITPQRNAWIDDIDNYLELNNYGKKQFTIQYQQLEANITIKLALPQAQVGEAEYNYAKLEQDERSYYFFIMGANWTARKTVKFLFSIDSINTWGNELEFTDRTSIARQHADRFEYNTTSSTLTRKIDKYSEGMTPVLNNEVETNTINQGYNAAGNKWYLIWASRPGITQDNTKDPIVPMLVADNSYKVAAGIRDADPKTIYIKKDRYYYVTNSYSDAELTIDGITFTLGSTKEFDGKTATLRCINFFFEYITAYGYCITCRKMYYVGDTYPYSYLTFESQSVLVSDPTHPTFTLNNCRFITVSNDFSEYYKTVTNLSTIENLERIEVNAGTCPELKTSTYKDFDRSNSTLMRIVELPYCPTTITKTAATVYSFADTTFLPGYNALQLNGELANTIYANIAPSESTTYALRNTDITKRPLEAMAPAAESKLYHSEFYSIKYAYGADVFAVALENFTTLNDLDTLSIDYTVTDSMNSDKMFKFNLPNSYYLEEPYGNYIMSSASTEKAILNNSYVDYLRNGYNYDQETTKRNNRMAGFNLAMGIAGSILNVATPMAAQWVGSARASRVAEKGGQTIAGIYNAQAEEALRNKSEATTKSGSARVNAPQWHKLTNYYSEQQTEYKVKAIQADLAPKSSNNALSTGYLINSGISAITSIANAVNSIATNDANLANNVNSKSYVSTNVTGNTPVDLRDEMCGNRVNHLVYTMRPEDRNNMAKVFHYIGYSHPVQEIPNTTSRYWFNFIQCEPQFKDEEVSTYTTFLDDIRARFGMGVTRFHKHNNTWDIDQTHENYEVWLCPTEEN